MRGDPVEFTYQEYLDIVDMRAAQKTYFNTREQNVLVTAKKLESRVDAIIARKAGAIVVRQGVLDMDAEDAEASVSAFAPLREMHLSEIGTKTERQ